MPLLRRHQHPDAPAAPPPEPGVIRLDASELTGLFAAPAWLRDLGVMSWLFVGFGLLIAGLVLLAAQLATIVVPVILGGVLAAVAGPLVRRMERHRIPRLLGAVIVLVLMMAVGIGVLLMILSGLSSQSNTISKAMNSALGEVKGWLNDAGITNTKVDGELKKSVPSAGNALLGGVVEGITALASIATFVVFTAFSTLFILKDGPTMRAWAERHMGIPEPIARIVTGNTIRALQQYFLGVTIVAAYNTFLIGGAALLLGIPLPGTIAVVTFFGAYIPFLGAWAAGIFAVALALSTGNTTDAVIMSVVALLANGILQQIVQPIAFGATLSLNPLVVLVSTIGGGCLFGMLGLVLAAPLVSAAVSITADIASARAEKEREGAAAQPPAAPPPEAGAAPAPA